MEKVSLEAVRLCHPQHVVFPRTIIKDCTINGINFKKRDLVTVAIGTNNRRPSWYPNPLKFDIERHNLDNSELLENDFIPYSYGNKSCVGNAFAKMLLKILIAEIIKIFDIKLPESYTRYIIFKNMSNQVESCKINLKLR